MLRAFTYVILGWLLLALCGGLADVLALTIVLPSTSAVVIAHAACARITADVDGSTIVSDRTSASPPHSASSSQPMIT